MNNKNKCGFTILELLVTLTVFSLVMAIGVPGFKAFSRKVEVNNGLRTATLALNTARYRAVEDNRSIKLSVEDNIFVLSKKKNNTWVPFIDFEPGDTVTVAINSSPIFYPEGYIVPLCSIYISCGETKHKITVSLAGRIKIEEL